MTASDATLALVRPLELAIGVVFAYAFATKIRSPHSFAATVRAYDIVPASAAPLVANSVLLMEVAIAVGLVAEVAPRWTAITSGTLLGLFLVALGVNLWRGRRVSCGCFGDASEQISWRIVTRVVLLLAASAALALTADAPRDRAIDLGAAVAIGALALATLAAGAWLTRADELIGVFRIGTSRRPPGGAS